MANYPAVPNNTVAQLISSYGIGGQPDPYITYFVTTFVNLFIQYPGCAAEYAGYLSRGCTNNYASDSIDLYYTAILSYKCNGPWCDTTQTLVNRTCQCINGYEPYNATYCTPIPIQPSSEMPPTAAPASVVPPSAPSSNNCQLYETLVNGTCQCSSGFIRDPNTGRCVCPPADKILNGTCVLSQVGTGQCVCPENEYYDYVQRKCRCLEGFYRDPSTGRCLIGKEIYY
jgi:hypothetical protein